MVDLLSLIAQVGDQNASRKVMPWAMSNPRSAGANVTADEVALAQAELEDGIVFAS